VRSVLLREARRPLACLRKRRLKPAPQFQTGLLPNIERHKYAVPVLGIFAEWTALDKPMSRIEGSSGREVRPRTCLQAEARHSVCPGRFDKVMEQRAGDAFAPCRLRRVHRFYLAEVGRQPPQCCNTNDAFLDPSGPESDVGRAQAIVIEGVGTVRPGFRSGSGHVGVQEFDDARIAQVTWPDLYHGDDLHPVRTTASPHPNSPPWVRGRGKKSLLPTDQIMPRIVGVILGDWLGVAIDEGGVDV